MGVKTVTVATCDKPKCGRIVHVSNMQPFHELTRLGWLVLQDAEGFIRTAEFVYCPEHAKEAKDAQR